MTSAEMIISLCFIFIHLTFADNEIPWENCDNDLKNIQLLNLTVNPYPIIAPGSLSVAITIRNSEEIASPLKAQLSLNRKVLFSYLHVPCISHIGSCAYDDLCSVCPELNCPLKPGDHVVTLPITIDAVTWALVGTYQAQVEIETKSGQKGCVKLSNVHIKSILCMTFIFIVQMYSINDNLDEFQRYQRGFGNRRALVTRLKHHYPNEILFGYDNQDNLREDKHLFSNPYEPVEQNDITQQRPRSSSIYR